MDGQNYFEWARCLFVLTRMVNFSPNGRMGCSQKGVEMIFPAMYACFGDYREVKSAAPSSSVGYMAVNLHIGGFANRGIAHSRKKRPEVKNQTGLPPRRVKYDHLGGFHALVKRLIPLLRLLPNFPSSWNRTGGLIPSLRLLPLCFLLYWLALCHGCLSGSHLSS